MTDHDYESSNFEYTFRVIDASPKSPASGWSRFIELCNVLVIPVVVAIISFTATLIVAELDANQKELTRNLERDKAATAAFTKLLTDDQGLTPASIAGLTVLGGAAVPVLVAILEDENYQSQQDHRLYAEDALVMISRTEEEARALIVELLIEKLMRKGETEVQILDSMADVIVRTRATGETTAALVPDTVLKRLRPSTPATMRNGLQEKLNSIVTTET